MKLKYLLYVLIAVLILLAVFAFINKNNEKSGATAETVAKCGHHRICQNPGDRGCTGGSSNCSSADC